jgi:hypothetical protein
VAEVEVDPSEECTVPLPTSSPAGDGETSVATDAAAVGGGESVGETSLWSGEAATEVPVYSGRVEAISLALKEPASSMQSPGPEPGQNLEAGAVLGDVGNAIKNEPVEAVVKPSETRLAAAAVQVVHGGKEREEKRPTSPAAVKTVSKWKAAAASATITAHAVKSLKDGKDGAASKPAAVHKEGKEIASKSASSGANVSSSKGVVAKKPVQNSTAKSTGKK